MYLTQTYLISSPTHTSRYTEIEKWKNQALILFDSWMYYVTVATLVGTTLQNTTVSDNQGESGTKSPD